MELILGDSRYLRQKGDHMQKEIVKKEEESVQIPAIQTETFKLNIVGTSPLICHRFSTKAKEMMLTPKASRVTTTKRAPRVPEQLYMDSLYPVEGKKNTYGFPASGFKKAAVSAARQIDSLPMTFLRGAFFVMGDLVEIDGKPSMREDIVRLNGKTADIRYRGEFKKWGATLIIEYNKGSITKAQIINLLNMAGFSVGVGEWRPERSGSYGMFKVAT